MQSWTRRSAWMAVTLVALLGILLARHVVLCDGELVTVPTPAGWETWPTLPDMGPFTLDHGGERCARDLHPGHARACAFERTELRDADLCPRCGIVLAPFSNPTVLHVSEPAGTYVVVTRGRPRGREMPVAFRRQATARLALRDRTTEVVSLGLALGALAIGAGLARRHLRRARAYEDRMRYRPATIEADRVVLDDDAEAYILADADVLPGRVLVRERPRRAADYRTTRTLVGGDIVRVDPATVLRVADVHAADALRIAFCVAVACATVAAVEAAGTWVHDRGFFHLT